MWPAATAQSMGHFNYFWNYQPNYDWNRVKLKSFFKNKFYEKTGKKQYFEMFWKQIS